MRKKIRPDYEDFVSKSGKLLPFKNKREEAVLIAMGPSKKEIHYNPQFSEGRSVCVINRAGYEWKGPIDYWISYHSELLARWWYKREIMGLPFAENAIAISTSQRKGPLEKIPHHIITKQVAPLNSGGTSSLLAAICLLDIGYAPVHVFGVDLNTSARSAERKYWRHLVGAPLVFYGKEDWFGKRNFKKKYEDADEED